MTPSLEDFAHSLSQELQQAQKASRRAWPGIRIATLNVRLDAAAERDNATGRLSLRIGPPLGGDVQLHELLIEVSGDPASMITARLDGKLLGHYRSFTDEESH